MYCPAAHGVQAVHVGVVVAVHCPTRKVDEAHDCTHGEQVALLPWVGLYEEALHEVHWTSDVVVGGTDAYMPALHCDTATA